MTIFWFIFWLVSAFLTGATLGIFVMALMCAGREKNERD